MKRHGAGLGLVLLLAAGISGAVLAASPDTDKMLPPEERAARALVRDTPGKWPKTIDEFINGGYLRRADVVLTRRDYDPVSWMIRWATDSPFSHAALVFTTPDAEPGYSSAFVIEAGTSGVDLTDLKHYAEDKSSFVAIKRIKTVEFDETMLSRVRGMLLDNIKSEYSYGTIVKLARNIWFGIERAVRGKEETIESFDQRNWERPNEFICSGFVQFGYLEAAIDFVMKRQLPLTALKDVVFRQDVASDFEFDPEALQDPEVYQSMLDQTVPRLRETFDTKLAAMTPDDLAITDRLDWLYMIKDGKVHQVHSRADVDRILASAD